MNLNILTLSLILFISCSNKSGNINSNNINVDTLFKNGKPRFYRSFDMVNLRLYDPILDTNNIVYPFAECIYRDSSILIIDWITGSGNQVIWRFGRTNRGSYKINTNTITGEFEGDETDTTLFILGTNSIELIYYFDKCTITYQYCNSDKEPTINCKLYQIQYRQANRLVQFKIKNEFIFVRSIFHLPLFDIGDFDYITESFDANVHMKIINNPDSLKNYIALIQ